MKIHLKNFRCYGDKSIDLGEKGIVLLSGASGTGKTTIMIGIYFALFGLGSKLVKKDKTSCKVKLEFNDYIITRTKRPNRLVVKLKGKEYEDDAGQEIINKLVGDTFKTTGYISQNPKDTFILMSPTEKLTFLERFAFKDYDLQSIKDRCKSLIKTNNETLIKTVSQLELSSNMLDDLDKPYSIPFPIVCSNKNRELVIKNEIVRMKNSKTILKKKNKHLKKLENESTAIKILDAFISNKRDSISSLNKKILTLKDEQNNNGFMGDEYLELYKKKLQTILIRTRYHTICKQYKKDKKTLDKMILKEENELKDVIEQISLGLWKEYSKEEANGMRKDLKEAITDFDIINKEKIKLENLSVDELVFSQKQESLKNKEKNLKILNVEYNNSKNNSKIYNCPSCDTKLSLKNHKLYKTDFVKKNDKELAIMEDEINKLENCIFTLKDDIFTLNRNRKLYNKTLENINNIKNKYEEIPEDDSYKEDLDYIEQYIHSQKHDNKRLETAKLNLSSKKLSNSLQDYSNDVSNLYNQMIELKKDYCDVSDKEEDEEKCRKIVIEQEKYRHNYNNIDNTIRGYNDDIDNYQCEINDALEKHSTKYGSNSNHSIITDKISTCKKDIVKYEGKLKEHTLNVENIEKYKEYKLKLEKYNVWDDKVKSLTNKSKIDRLKYSSSMLLKDKIIEAESIAIYNIISKINTHARIYLDLFFPTDPITVNLVNYKQGKKSKKPQICLQIEYKGMEADINMLSGGELSRVVLAFTLAFSEMFNTPLLMLDECTSSLDQELTETIMDGIREEYNGSLVLIIAHQTIEGAYDKVVKF